MFNSSSSIFSWWFVLCCSTALGNLERWGNDSLDFDSWLQNARIVLFFVLFGSDYPLGRLSEGLSPYSWFTCRGKPCSQSHLLRPDHLWNHKTSEEVWCMSLYFKRLWVSEHWKQEMLGTSQVWLFPLLRITKTRALLSEVSHDLKEEATRNFYTSPKWLVHFKEGQFDFRQQYIQLRHNYDV